MSALLFIPIRPPVGRIAVALLLSVHCRYRAGQVLEVAGKGAISARGEPAVECLGQGYDVHDIRRRRAVRKRRRSVRIMLVNRARQPC